MVEPRLGNSSSSSRKRLEPSPASFRDETKVSAYFVENKTLQKTNRENKTLHVEKANVYTCFFIQNNKCVKKTNCSLFYIKHRIKIPTF